MYSEGGTKMKWMKTSLMFLVLIVAMTTMVAAVNLNVNYVKINGEEMSQAINRTNNLQIERGEDVTVKVCIKATQNVKDAQIEADIYGYRYSTRDSQKVSDTTPTFNLDQNDTVCKTLNVQIPEKMDMDYYKLRVRVGDRDSTSFENNYELHVAGIARSSAVQVKDFTIDPKEIIAGRAFTSMIKVRNYGDDDLTDLKATISVPSLNIETSEYMDELNADDSKTFEELLLRIPECAKPGTYDVVFTIEFDEYEETTTRGTIKVLSSETCGAVAPNNNVPAAQRTVITVPNYQEITQGTSVVYPIMITNPMNTAKTYTITVSGTSNWASSRIDPGSVVVVSAGSSKTVYLYVSALANAEIGDKAFTLTIDSSDGDTRQVPITAKITKNAGSTDSNWNSVKNGLEIGLVILVIILIIIGLIIGFNKLKENKNEKGEEYY